MVSRPDVEISSNLVHKSKFQVSFDGIPNFTFYCQQVDIPGISINEAAQAGPFVDGYAAGTKATFDSLTMTVLVDENLMSWFEIHDWVRRISLADGFKDPNIRPTPTEDSKYSDCTVTVLNANHVPNVRFKFYKCFPSAFGALQFDTRSSPSEVMAFAVRFRYFYYDPIRLPKPLTS